MSSDGGQPLLSSAVVGDASIGWARPAQFPKGFWGHGGCWRRPSPASGRSRVVRARDGSGPSGREFVPMGPFPPALTETTDLWLVACNRNSEEKHAWKLSLAQLPHRDDPRNKAKTEEKSRSWPISTGQNRRSTKEEQTNTRLYSRLLSALSNTLALFRRVAACPCVCPVQQAMEERQNM